MLRYFWCIILMAVCSRSPGQTVVLKKWQHDLTVNLVPIVGIDMKMNSLSEGTLSKSKPPGGLFNVEYALAFKQRWNVSIGLGGQVLPSGVKYVLPSEKFNPTQNQSDIVGTVTDYSGFLLFVPVKAGYRFETEASISPFLNFGVNLYRQSSFASSTTYSINNPIYRFTIASPQGEKARIIQTYTFTGGVSRKLENSGRVHLAILLNASGNTFYRGIFQAAYNDGLQIAEYKDSGSFAGIQLGYTFPKRNSVR